MSIRLVLIVAAATLLPSCLDGGGSVVARALIAPANLTALHAADGSSIELAWVDNSSDETGFRVDVAPVPINVDADVTEFTILPSNTTAYSYATQPNTTRYFRVLAVTTSLQSEPSNVVSATTPNVPPPPGRFDAQVGPSGSDTIVSLLWDDAASETGYTIDRSANGGSWDTLTTTGQNVTSIADFSTAANGDYAYRIRANNANGSGPWSPVVRAQTHNTSWEILSSPASGDVSWFTSLAVTPFGNAYVSSYDASMGQVAYSVSGILGPISTSNIDPGFPATLGFSGTSIVSDSLGFSHIVANDSFANVLRHLTNAPSGNWTSEAIDSPTTSGDRALFGIGSSDSLHVVYQRQNSGMIPGLRYGVRSGSSWTTEWVTSSDVTDYFSFAVGPGNSLHVAYRRPTPGGHELVYASRSGGSWYTSVVPTTGSPEMCSIAVDAAGVVYIAYNSLMTGGLNLLSNSGGTWTDEVVHQSPLARWGRYNSLAIDKSTGEIHISYQEAIYTSLRCASKLPGGAWVLQHVDGAGDVGCFSSIGTDANGNVFIAYGDATNGRVKLARTALRPPSNLVAAPISTSRIDVSWGDVPNEKSYRLERSLDGGSSWGTAASLPLNTLGYSDTGLSSNQLYSYRVIAENDFDESAPSNVATVLPCYITTVSVPGSTAHGQGTDIAVGPGNAIHVAHYDQTNANLLYTTGPLGGPFTTVTADSGSPATSAVGADANGIALGGSTPVLVGDQSPAGIGALGGLRFTTVTGMTPSSTTLEASQVNAIVGYYSKVRVAPNGTVHVVHMEQGIGGWYWRHALRVGGTWTFAGRIIPLELLTGHYNNNLGIDSLNNPHLAYIRRPTAAAPTEIVYGSMQSGVWSFAVIPGPVQPFFPTLALDSSNKAHLAFVSNGNTLGYATNASGSWVVETVDPSIFSVGTSNPAIGVDPSTGRVHVAYASSGLRYARKDPGGIWVRVPLDTTTGVEWVSMALGSGGIVNVAYQDSFGLRLKILSAQP